MIPPEQVLVLVFCRGSRHVDEILQYEVMDGGERYVPHPLRTVRADSGTEIILELPLACPFSHAVAVDIEMGLLGIKTFRICGEIVPCFEQVQLHIPDDDPLRFEFDLVILDDFTRSEPYFDGFCQDLVDLLVFSPEFLYIRRRLCFSFPKYICVPALAGKSHDVTSL